MKKNIKLLTKTEIAEISGGDGYCKCSNKDYIVETKNSGDCQRLCCSSAIHAKSYWFEGEGHKDCPKEQTPKSTSSNFPSTPHSLSPNAGLTPAYFASMGYT